MAILPATPSEPYPPYPAEVDDAYITPHHIGEQPPGIVPLITGFNANCAVYNSYASLAKLELAYGTGEIFDFNRQKRLLETCIHDCKSVLDGLPTELKVWPSEGQFGQANQAYIPPLPEYHHARDMQIPNALVDDQDPAARRQAQYEIQKANIYASHLSTRSYIVEKYFNMRDATQHMKQQDDMTKSPDVASAGLDSILQQQQAPSGDMESTDTEMANEREQIIKDLLVVLGSISQVNMEPNGDSFVSEMPFVMKHPLTIQQTSKTRQVAATLLDVPKNRKGTIALQADSYLVSFLDILSRLERASPGSSDGMQPLDDESELRAWADLREYQTKFQQASGIFGFAA